MASLDSYNGETCDVTTNLGRYEVFLNNAFVVGKKYL